LGTAGTAIRAHEFSLSSRWTSHCLIPMTTTGRTGHCLVLLKWRICREGVMSRQTRNGRGASRRWTFTLAWNFYINGPGPKPPYSPNMDGLY